MPELTLCQFYASGHLVQDTRSRMAKQMKAVFSRLALYAGCSQRRVKDASTQKIGIGRTRILTAEDEIIRIRKGSALPVLHERKIQRIRQVDLRMDLSPPK